MDQDVRGPPGRDARYRSGPKPIWSETDHWRTHMASAAAASKEPKLDVNLEPVADETASETTGSDEDIVDAEVVDDEDDKK